VANQNNTLHAYQVSGTGTLLGEITIDGLVGDILRVKANGTHIETVFPPDGVPGDVDTDIVLTVPAITGVSLAAWMEVDT
jgi:hypothetical protein